MVWLFNNIIESIKKIGVSIIFWTSVISMPLILTVFDFNIDNYLVQNDFYRSPLGLILGIQSVVVGHFFTLFYFYSYRKNQSLNFIQKNNHPEYVFNKELIKHLTKPEGLIMLGGYLSFMWMYGYMPASYYSFKGGINWLHVALQLVIQDFTQYFIHLFEHKSRIPLLCHKLHHRFINPKLFDAYDGSISDTFLMILIPLFITSRIVPSNTWSYIVFGCIYANWLALIHSEYEHPWDKFFKFIGFGTSPDQHVHHKLFTNNFGHLFMYWDKLFGTYRDPNSVPGLNINN